MSRPKRTWPGPVDKVRVGIDCKVFYIPRCSNTGCRAALSDAAGNPRWDLLEGRFVCLGGCRPTPTATAIRKAGLL